MQRLSELRRRLEVEINAIKGVYQKDLSSILPYCKNNGLGLHEVYQDVVLKCNGDTLLKKYVQVFKHYQNVKESDNDETICDVLLDTIKRLYEDVTEYQNTISKCLGAADSSASVDDLRSFLEAIVFIHPSMKIPCALMSCLSELERIHDLHSKLLSRNEDDEILYDERFLVKNDVEIQQDNEEFVRRGQENFEKFTLEQEEKSQKVANHQMRHDPRIIT